MAFDSRQPSGPGAPSTVCVPGPNSQIRRLLSRWGDQPFGVNDTPLESPARLTSNSRNRIRGPSASSGEPAWWTAEINAQELQRRVNADIQVFPSSVDIIRSNGGGCSKLWAEVKWHREGIGNRAVFDIGPGMRIGVHACNVQLDIIRPPDSVSVRGNGTPPEDPERTPFIEGPGLYLDTLIRASLTEGLAPLRHEALLTQTLNVPNGGAWSFPCPPGATGVEVFISTATGAPGAPTQAAAYVELLDPTGALPPAGFIAPIELLTIAAGRTGVVERPGNAAGIAGSNDSGAPLVYTIVWNLEF